MATLGVDIHEPVLFATIGIHRLAIDLNRVAAMKALNKVFEVIAANDLYEIHNVEDTYECLVYRSAHVARM